MEARYLITIYVTTEQEEAIQYLYNLKGWTFLKTGKESLFDSPPAKSTKAAPKKSAKTAKKRKYPPAKQSLKHFLDTKVQPSSKEPSKTPLPDEKPTRIQPARNRRRREQTLEQWSASELINNEASSDATIENDDDGHVSESTISVASDAKLSFPLVSDLDETEEISEVKPAEKSSHKPKSPTKKKKHYKEANVNNDVNLPSQVNALEDGAMTTGRLKEVNPGLVPADGNTDQPHSEYVYVTKRQSIGYFRSKKSDLTELDDINDQLKSELGETYDANRISDLMSANDNSEVKLENLDYGGEAMSDSAGFPQSGNPAETDIARQKIDRVIRDIKVELVERCNTCKMHLYKDDMSESHRQLDCKSILQHAQTEQGYFCHMCCITFTAANTYVRHMLNDTCNNSTCRECGLIFTTRELYEKHQNLACAEKLQANRVEEGYHCRGCQATFKSSSTFIEHKIHRMCVGSMLKCEFCGKTYPSRRRTCFTMHIRNHLDDRRHECKECGKRYLRQETLRDHMRIHTGVRPYQCSFCSLTFTTGSHKRNHEMLRHLEVPRSHVCHICGKGFKFRARLNAHLEIVHVEGENHPCEICGKKFKAKSLLKEHKKIHRTEKNHICDVCGSSFITAKYLTSHMKRHSETKNHVCDDCGKRFFTRQHLLIHERVHSGEKPYLCTLCEYRCTCRGNLCKHIKTVHNKLQPGPFVRRLSPTRETVKDRRQNAHVHVETLPPLPSKPEPQYAKMEEHIYHDNSYIPRPNPMV